MSRSTRLLGLGAAAAVLVPLTLVAPASVAAPTQADLNPSVAAGDWLADQVVAGTGDQTGQGFLVSAYNAAPGYDFGLASDAIVSFGRQGSHQEAVTSLTAGLEANYGGYVRPALPSAEGGTYLNAGALAKTVLAADVTDSARDFGGEDLVALLEGTVTSDGLALNQGGSQQGQGSVFAQTYAVQALDVTGSTKADDAALSLLDHQCADGGFSFTFVTEDSGCYSDVDTTARVAIVLSSEEFDGFGMLAAVQATEWLATQQRTDGSFGFEYDGTFTPSVSSSLLAAQAFTAINPSRFSSPAVRAAGFARSLQLDSVTAKAGLASDLGATLASPDDFAGATTAGALSTFERTGATFAAAQAYDGLAVLDGTTKFSDTATSATFFPEISWLSGQGITTGYAEADGTTSFRGSQPVLREQMAAFLYRYENDGANPPSDAPNATFSDARTNTFTKHIAWLASEGITTGYPDGTFRPSAPVLREQMAAFLYRLAGEPPFTAPATSPFADVPTTATFYKQITWLASTGITTGYTEGGVTTFRGGEPVLREQMAAFLFRYDALPSDS